MRAETLLRAGAELGEGPVWLVGEQRLAWVDIDAGQVHRARLDGSHHDVVDLGAPVGAVVEAVDGGLVAAVPDGLVRLDGHRVADIPRPEPDLRMNDAAADPAGRFVGGSMTFPPPRPGAGTLWSVDGAGTRSLLDGVTISNGLAWTDGGDTMFYVDSATGRIDAIDYDVATGRLGERRPWVAIDPDDGEPDGICLDAEGGLWVAIWGGACVRRYLDGRLDQVVEVPVAYPSCPAFAADDRSLLVVTSARTGYEGPVPDGAGDLFAVEPGVSGAAVHRLGDWAR